jgi:hypothetical protein
LGDAKDRPAYTSIRARVQGATIGIGVLNRKRDHFLDRCSVEPSEVVSEIRVAIPRVKDASDLVVLTWDRAESATVHIESVDLVVFSESSLAAQRARVKSRRGR